MNIAFAVNIRRNYVLNYSYSGMRASPISWSRTLLCFVVLTVPARAARNSWEEATCTQLYEQNTVHSTDTEGALFCSRFIASVICLSVFKPKRRRHCLSQHCVTRCFTNLWAGLMTVTALKSPSRGIPPHYFKRLWCVLIDGSAMNSTSPPQPHPLQSYVPRTDDLTTLWWNARWLKAVSSIPRNVISLSW